MLAYWDTDLNKSVDFFLNPICILLVVCPSTIAVCIAIYANKILFKLIKNGDHVGFILIRCAEELRYSGNLSFFFIYFILLSYATFSSPHLTDSGDILNQMHHQYSFLNEDSVKNFNCFPCK